MLKLYQAVYLLCEVDFAISENCHMVSDKGRRSISLPSASESLFKWRKITRCLSLWLQTQNEKIKVKNLLIYRERWNSNWMT